MYHADEPRAIISLAIVEPETLRVQIPEKMEQLDGNVCAFDAPLEQCPKVFQPVRMVVAALFSHGIFDFILAHLIRNPGVPA